MIRKTIFVTAMGLMSGCVSQIEEKVSEGYDPIYPVEAAAQTVSLATGGIYTASSAGLFASDRRAARVGDILTVQFSEKFAASKTQSASGGRSNSYEIDLPNL